MTKNQRRMATNFKPYDDEKLMGYLLKYVCGIPIQCNQIRFVNLYGNKKPSELFDTTTDHVNYFFTQLKKKTGKGKNFNRAIVGGCSWKGLDKSKSVFDKKGLVIGYKKTFRFVDDDDHPHVWIMKEYHLNDKILQALRQRRQIRYEDIVVCRLTRNVNSSKVVPLDHSGQNYVASYLPISSLQHQENDYFPKSSPLYQFQETQDFGRADASVIPSDQLRSNSQLSLLTTESNVVRLISTEGCSVPMYQESPSVQYQFQENQDFRRVDAGAIQSGQLSSNSKVSLLTTESNVVPVTQLPMISTEECSVPMVYALDEETACVSASDYDIASYHEGIDAYAAAMLELNPLFVPYVLQDEDQCPLFSEDFYIGHTALWG
ncbi:hypothetical protein RND71_036801 [Anisodus tanguticus]|uniref:NAC domain-containing protein n=1 Tax=Anisodus tanguticus TaxID=243964 RepID=A0AAE1R4C5_9SOLA|nr:hypothetical protein RND71_036801 [Anisodus tanguticus]